MVAEPVRSFFQGLADELLESEPFAMLNRFELPVAVYLGDDAFIFDDRAKVLRGLRAYSMYLWSLDVQGCTVTVVDEAGQRGAEACYSVSARYVRSDGGTLGVSRSNYYLAEVDGSYRIRMIEIHALPVDRLPFRISDFQ